MKKMLFICFVGLSVGCSSEETETNSLVALTGHWDYYSNALDRNSNSSKYSSLTITPDVFKINSECDFFTKGSYDYTVKNYQIIENSEQVFYATFVLIVQDLELDCKLSKTSKDSHNGYLTISYDQQMISYVK